MNTEKKLIDLVQTLEERTTNDIIHWESTAVEDVFQVGFSKYVVKLSRRPNQETDRAIDYVISIFNESGTCIESIDDVQLQRASGNQGNIYPVLKSLYDEARRQALNVDGAVDSILSELDVPF